MPTLLTLAGVAPPPSLSGRSLLEPSMAPAESPEPFAGLEYRQSVFSRLEGPEDLFAFGSYAGWIGFRDPETRLEQHREATVSLLGQAARISRKAGGRVIPAWVFGWIESDFNLGGFGVAVAVDGVVAATGECEWVEGRNRLNLLLPAWVLSPGDHLLEVLLIEPVTQRGWRLPIT